ncbi:hypothetical protein K1X76_10860 [bacterium]|nr:hypothetical protein [bacterium]
MFLTVAYHLSLVLIYILSFIAFATGSWPPWLIPYEQPIFSILLGGLGGAIYCLRGVYINACALKQWDLSWRPWHFIRPIVSLACGFISYIFLKAGLLVLDATLTPEANHFGFYALAFIAGLNVDRFIERLEEIAHGTWSIKHSRTSEANGKDKKD